MGFHTSFSQVLFWPVLLLFVTTKTISSSILNNEERGAILASNHEVLGTFDAFVDDEDLLNLGSDQVSQRITKKVDDPDNDSTRGKEKQSTMTFTRNFENKKPEWKANTNTQNNRPIRRFKINPYEMKEFAEGETTANPPRMVRVRKLKRKPLEFARTTEPTVEVVTQAKTTTSTATTTKNPVSHIRVINKEERSQKRKKNKSLEKNVKLLVPALSDDRIFKPPAEASISRKSNEEYKALRLSNLPATQKPKSSEGRPINIQPSKSVSIRTNARQKTQPRPAAVKELSTAKPKQSSTATTKQLSPAPVSPRDQMDVKTYVPVLPTNKDNQMNYGPVPEINYQDKKLPKDSTQNDSIKNDAQKLLEQPQPYSFPSLLVPQQHQQHYYNPFTVIPPQRFQQPMNYQQAQPVVSNLPLYSNFPYYYQAGDNPASNSRAQQQVQPQQVQANHPFLVNPHNINPYQDWQPYGLPGFHHSPQVASLRRSIWDEEAEDVKREVEEPVTPFTIPKFDIPSIDYNQEGCQTKIKEVKEVPFPDISVPGRLRRQKRRVKSVIMTRECFFPKGIPVGQGIVKESVQETVKTSGKVPQESETQTDNETQTAKKLDDARETLAALETKDNRNNENTNLQHSKSPLKENIPTFREPYFSPQFGYIFDE